MDKPINNRPTNKKVADRNRVGNSRADAYSASISPVYHEDAEAAELSDIKRADATKVTVRREIWPG